MQASSGKAMDEMQAILVLYYTKEQAKIKPLLLLLAGAVRWLGKVEPPKALWRTVAALILGGQALQRILQGQLISIEQVAFHSSIVACILGSFVPWQHSAPAQPASRKF